MIQRRSDGLVGDELRYSELDDALGLTAPAGDVLADARTGKNGRHAPVGLLWQSVFGCLAGYENVNDAERLRHDPAMRWIVGGKAPQAARLRQAGWAASLHNLHKMRRCGSGAFDVRCTLNSGAKSNVAGCPSWV